TAAWAGAAVGLEGRVTGADRRDRERPGPIVDQADGLCDPGHTGSLRRAEIELVARVEDDVRRGTSSGHRQRLLAAGGVIGDGHRSGSDAERGRREVNDDVTGLAGAEAPSRAIGRGGE